MFCSSCTNRESVLTIVNMEKLSGINKQQGFPIEEAFSDVQLIPLETNDSCLIGNIRLFKESSQYLFVCDNDNNGILQFASTGKFVRRIGKQGKGPEEFSAYDFDLDDRGKIIYIYDYFQQKMVKYDFDGKFIESYRVPVVEGMVYMRFMAPGKLIFMTAHNSHSPEVFLFSEQEKAMAPIRKKERKTEAGAAFGGQKAIYAYRDRVCFQHAFNDTVFMVEEEKLLPAFILKTSKYQYGFEEYVNFNSTEIRLEITNLIETITKILVKYEIADHGANPFERKSYLAYYNKDNQQIIMNCVFHHPEQSIMSFNGGFYQGNANRLYAIREAYEFSELPGLPVAIKEEDNPILIRYTYK